MELDLSLGDSRIEKAAHQKNVNNYIMLGENLGLCMALGGGQTISDNSSSDPPPTVQLAQRSQQTSLSNKFPFPWLSEKLGNDLGRGMDANRIRRDEEGASPNSTAVPSFQVDSSTFKSTMRAGNVNYNTKRDHFEANITSDSNNETDRGSDEDDNLGMTRKKLRLSKDQSAFLEESFKEHNTLSPKQKLSLAKQLGLRPRQVEVWFQNRRARTKLKQTEVDCEYLKRYCETLTEENRRLQKELQELRALNKASKPFYMQLQPATTLTMCASCEKLANNNNSTTSCPSPPDR